jgi:hypothetical protein
MANKVYASPGVYTSEKDLTFTTETVGVTTLGLVGETKKGPAFQPIFVRNYDEFKVSFGGTSPEKFRNTQIVKYELPYIAKSYLSQSNQLFVTRVLGLSGYNAGAAYAIRTLGSCDKETLEYTTTQKELNFVVNLTGSEAGKFFFEDTNVELIDKISDETGIDPSKFEIEYYDFFNIVNITARDWYRSNVLFWGILDPIEQADIVAERNSKQLTLEAPVNPSFLDAYELPIGIPISDRTDNILINEFTFNESTDEYEGSSFALFAYDITGTTATQYSGNVKLRVFNYKCQPNQKYHKKTVATLRSRGQFIANELTFSVDENSPVNFDQFDNALVNPFANFSISGVTNGGTEFSYNISLDKTKKNYVKNVLGTEAFDKDTFLFVDEVYDSVLRKGWNFNEIKGLHQKLVLVNSWNHYKFQFQSPATPFFVSELRGGLPQRLFRLISISDGNSANTEIKVSIAAVDLDRKTFDVYIRSFNDSDRNPVFLERYLGVTMDETRDNYIGRRIGTIDNKYPLRSSYVVVEIAENAPKDGVASGFEGYEFRTSGVESTEETFCGVPDISYKTKYYAPGEVIVDPPFSLPIISTGDKVRKVYLGFTDLEYGYDVDLLSFKGKVGDLNYNDGGDWFTKTKGFHMDIDSSNIVNTQGDAVFESGVGTFIDPVEIVRNLSHPYHDIRTRKFTALFAGGFDGWDIYREQRTNVDDYKIGRNSFVAAGFDTFTSVEFGELFGTSDYYATLYGVKAFENPEQTVINILATPGIDIINNTELVRDTIEIIEERRFDSIYLPTLPDIKLIGNNNAGNTEDWLYPNDIIAELDNTEIDSNYTAVYYPWIQISDTENNANLFIPPTAEVVRNLAFTDNVAHPWFATAGYNRGIVNCIRARIALDQESRDILYPGRINPIATFSDVGNVIWGNRNLQLRDSALNRLNIRRLLLQARRLIVSVANRLLFDPNDAQVRSEFLSLVNPILDNIRRERGLTDFRVSLVNDVEDDDRNTLRGKIFIKPTPTLEFIELEFVVTPTSVSFDNL